MWWWRFKGNFLGLGFPPLAPEFDADGLMVPPWIRWPGFNLCQMSFREHWGGDYTRKFCDWWEKQPDDVRRLVAEKYPAAKESGWFGFLDEISGNGQAWSKG